MAEADDKAREDGLAALRAIRKLAEKGMAPGWEVEKPAAEEHPSPNDPLIVPPCSDKLES